MNAIAKGTILRISMRRRIIYAPGCETEILLCDTNIPGVSFVYRDMDGHPIAERLPIATADDPSARLASLFDAHFDQLYRLARRLSLNTDDALDLVQETFLRAARSPASVP